MSNEWEIKKVAEVLEYATIHNIEAQCDDDECEECMEENRKHRMVYMQKDAPKTPDKVVQEEEESEVSTVINVEEC